MLSLTLSACKRRNTKIFVYHSLKFLKVSLGRHLLYPWFILSLVWIVSTVDLPKNNISVSVYKNSVGPKGETCGLLKRSSC